MSSVPDMNFLNGLYEYNQSQLYNQLDETLDKAQSSISNLYLIFNKEEKEYESTYELLLNEQFNHVVKIDSLLQILIISHESETIKVKYTECLSYHISPDIYSKFLKGIRNQDLDLELKTIKECAELKNEEQVLEYKEVIRRKLDLSFIDRVDSINSFITDYILCIVKIKRALKNFYI